jgi:uncharacterized protein YyaL (SSP411 family)
MTGGDGRLAHSWRAGRSHPGTLDDHANMARAALLLYEATGRQPYLDRAVLWVDILDRHFADTAGGYFFTADDTETLITRTKSAADNAVPAGNAVMIEVLARLHLLTGDAKYLTGAETSIATFAGEIEHNFFPLGTYLNGIDFLARAAHVIIIGTADAADTKQLAAAAHAAGDATILVQILSPGQSLPDGHPAKGKGRLGEMATAYLCRDQSCSAPLIDSHALATALSRS